MIEERAPDAGDRDALFGLHADAFREHVIATWGAWDEEAQRRTFDDAWPEWCTGRVLVDAGQVVGYYRVEAHEDHRFLDLLELAPSHRGRGLGRAIMLRLLEAELPLVLSVLQVNVRARAFYQRLGFVAIAETKERCRMRHLAQAISASSSNDA